MTDAEGTGPPRSGGPKGPITDQWKKPLPKRFYKDVSVSAGEGNQILLDGRPVKTPGKRPLALPTAALAAAIADEWSAQRDVINPATMPLTRFANTAIDAVTEKASDVAADIAAYSSSDLLCYRAEDPHDLVVRQSAEWDPVIAWARDVLGADFVVTRGVMPVAQPEQAVAAVAAALEPHDAFRLTGLHVMTTLTGSALLALAHARGFLSADEAWRAAHVDEDYQIAQWGEDGEAAARRASRHTEFLAASRFLTSLD